MEPGPINHRERTLQLAEAFLAESRRDLERAAAQGADLPPRIRTVQTRQGHTTPEYRTLAVPVPDGASGASPQVLSSSISRYAANQNPDCLLLVLDAQMQQENGEAVPVLIAEARDRAGTRLFYMQPFRQRGSRLAWEEPLTGGWKDPDDEELILDAAFTHTVSR